MRREIRTVLLRAMVGVAVAVASVAPASAKMVMNIGYATSDQHAYGTFMITFA